MTSFRLSCRDNSFPTLSLQAVFAVLVDLGLEGVDISVSDRHHQLDPAAVVEDPSGLASNVRRLLAPYDLAVADCFALTGFGPNTLPVNAATESERTTARAQFVSFVRFAGAIGAPGLTVLPGIGDDAGARDLAATELAWRRGVAADAGLGLSVEPYQASVVKSPADVRRLVEDVSGLQLTLDYSHFVAAGYDDVEVDGLLPYTRHLQARQASPGNLQTVIEDGRIDFGRVVRLLAESGYAGWIGFEYVWNSWIKPEVDTLGQTTMLRDQLRAVMSQPIAGR